METEKVVTPAVIETAEVVKVPEVVVTPPVVETPKVVELTEEQKEIASLKAEMLILKETQLASKMRKLTKVQKEQFLQEFDSESHTVKMKVLEFMKSSTQTKELSSFAKDEKPAKSEPSTPEDFLDLLN